MRKRITIKNHALNLFILATVYYSGPVIAEVNSTVHCPQFRMRYSIYTRTLTFYVLLLPQTRYT